MENSTPKTMTIKELLELTAGQLEGISGIPISLANDVSRPIWEAVQNIRECINAMNREPEQPEEVENNGEGDGV